MSTAMKKDGPLQVPIINLPPTIRKVFGEKGSDDFVGVLNDIQDAQIHRTIQRVEDKFELRLVTETTKLDKHISVVETKLEQESAKLNERISSVETRLDHRITEESAKLNERISLVETRLDHRITEESAKLDHRITAESAKLGNRISESQANLIKWMFIFWAGQAAMMAGILIHFSIK